MTFQGATVGLVVWAAVLAYGGGGVLERGRKSSIAVLASGLGKLMDPPPGMSVTGNY